MFLKTKDLCFPYSFQERKPTLTQNVLFVPKYFFQHRQFIFPHLNQLFDNQNPVYLELCSGNGEWIIEKAKTQPQVNWIAVEQRFDRVRKIWTKRENNFLNNLFIVCGEAFTFIHEYVQKNSIQEVFVNFPDPWPKDRHAKNRLITCPFIEDVFLILQKQSRLTIATDDENYIEEIDKVFKTSSLWEKSPQMYFSETYGSSFFQNLWIKKGKSLHFLTYTTVNTVEKNG